VFFAFDLLFLNGESTAQLPLIERKERLKRLFREKIDGLLYSEHVAGDGPPLSRTRPASSASKAPSQSERIDHTPLVTVGSGSNRSASTGRSSWSSAGRIRKAADRT
jgi:hypothetical protein